MRGNIRIARAPHFVNIFYCSWNEKLFILYPEYTLFNFNDSLYRFVVDKITEWQVDRNSKCDAWHRYYKIHFHRWKWKNKIEWNASSIRITKRTYMYFIYWYSGCETRVKSNFKPQNRQWCGGRYIYMFRTVWVNAIFQVAARLMLHNILCIVVDLKKRRMCRNRTFRHNIWLL